MAQLGPDYVEREDKGRRDKTTEKPRQFNKYIKKNKEDENPENLNTDNPDYVHETD